MAGFMDNFFAAQDQEYGNSLFGSGSLFDRLRQAQAQPTTMVTGTAAPQTFAVPGVNAAVPSVPGAVTPQFSTWERLFGSDRAGTGVVSPLVGAAQAGMNFWLGGKQLGLAEEQLDTSKSQFEKQFDVQKQQYNRELLDTARRRYSANPAAFEDPDVYYEKHRIA